MSTMKNDRYLFNMLERQIGENKPIHNLKFFPLCPGTGFVIHYSSMGYLNAEGARGKGGCYRHFHFYLYQKKKRASF